MFLCRVGIAFKSRKLGSAVINSAAGPGRSRGGVDAVARSLQGRSQLDARMLPRANA
jgi:hypothetical protein